MHLLNRTKTDPALKRNYLAGLKAFALWARNPVSEFGASQNFKMVFAVGGPTIRHMIEGMRAHPEGRRILADRPDLGAAINNMKALRELPEGSMGRTYYEFMSGEGIIPGYVLAGLAYKGGDFDRLEWPEEMKWLVERIGNTHDMTHMLSGYGADLAGETLNIAFSLGLYAPSPFMRNLTRVEALGTGLAFRPKCGMTKWVQYMLEAYERGARASKKTPFNCVYFEELLPLSLEEVRGRLGVMPPENPTVLHTEDWYTSKLAEQAANGYGAMDKAMERIECTKAMVESGIAAKAIMRAPRKDAERARQLFQQGARNEAVLQALEAHPRV